jgi:SNARE protein
MSWPKTEQEEKIQELFDDLDKGFKKLDRTSDEAKKQAMLKDLTNKLKDAKT